MVTAIVLFAIAALGGIVLASLRLRNRPLPMSLALIHGAVAAAGIVALIVVMAHVGHVATPLVLFIVAALGGFVLFSFHLRGKNVPIPVMVIHAVIAAIGLVLLLVRL